MALMSSFFKGKKTNSDITFSDDPLTLKALNQLIPVRNLSDDKLESFALEHKPEILPKGHVLFKINETSNTAIFLLKGSVSISDENGKTFNIDASEVKAKFPLSSGRKHTTTATATTEINILRVSQKVMAINSIKPNPSKLVIPNHLSNNQLLHTFVQHFVDDDLEVPSLPSIAIKLRTAMQNEIGIEEAVKIIQLDPVISAKLIEVANCPLYVCLHPAKSCFEAVQRIGLNATRNLVISLSIKNIFSSKSPLIKKQLDHQWKKSIYLSSLCFILASADKQIIPEEALLAGLVADIGTIPFLNFVAKLPADYYNEEEINQAIPVVKGVVGSTILENWGFAEEFIKIPLTSEDWHYHGEENITYSDIVILSRLHSKIGQKSSNLPAITSIPAASKLKSITLSPENSLSILHDAKDKINETLQTFST